METGLRGIAGPCQVRADKATDLPPRPKLDQAIHGLGDALQHPDGWRDGSGGASSVTINNGPGISGGGTGSTFTLSAQECVERSFFRV